MRVIVPTAELLHVPTLPDFDRVGAIQSYWANPETRTFAELLIDCEEERSASRPDARRRGGYRPVPCG